MRTQPKYYKSIEQYCKENNLIIFHTIDNHAVAFCSKENKHVIFHHGLENGMFYVDSKKSYSCQDEVEKTEFSLLRIGLDERI